MFEPVFQENVPLSRCTTFRIGGPARFFLVAQNAEQVCESVLMAQKMGVPWKIIGQGSNILAADEGYVGAVIAFKNNVKPRMDQDGNVRVSGGAALSSLIDFMARAGIAGTEDLAGIPGTVGGAIAGNAGAYGTPISKALAQVRLLDKQGNITDVPCEDIAFDYRSSSVKDQGSIVLEATFSGLATERSLLRETVRARLDDRAKKHPDPERVGTAGSYFKNPLGADGKRIAAGRLLEEAGCKEFHLGGARLWHSHANIIIADQGARATDVVGLAQEMAACVGERLGFQLSAEVQFLG